MPGLGTSHTTSDTQSSQRGDIGPLPQAMPAVQNLLNGIQGINYQPTQAQTSALGTMQNNAGLIPNFGPQAQGIASNLVGGGTDYRPMVNDAYSQYQNQMMPYANGQNLDPTQAPGMQGVLDTIRNDVSNNVNGMFAGAGRDLSGMNQQSLARGIAQGEAAPLLGQYNQNVQNQMNAANGLFGNATSAAGVNSGLQQTMFGNQVQGATQGPEMIGQALNASPMASLQAASAAYGLPISQLAQLAGLTVPIAGLGKSYEGSANSSTQGSSTMSPLQEGLGILGGLTTPLFGGGSASALGMGMNFLSDRSAKEDISRVGSLDDGTPVYRFRYRGDPRYQIGLMADEVERYAPEAIGEWNGLKTVDYDKATRRAMEVSRGIA